MFRDELELDQLESQVEVNNQTVLAAEARVRQAQAQVAVTRAPSFLTANVGATNDKVGVTAGWELDLWGRIRRSVEASTANAQASVETTPSCPSPTCRQSRFSSRPNPSVRRRAGS